MEAINYIIYFSVFVGLYTISFYVLSMFSERKKVSPKYKFEDLPKVSVLIAMYNEEKTIAKTIESAANLNYPDGRMEVIVINDGSKDKSLEIAKKYQGKMNGKKIKVLSQENTGKGGALNLGLKHAKGEVVISMDADTYADKDAAAKMCSLFVNPKIMCVTPSMVPYKPKKVIEKLQYMEYFLGIFLRSAFSSLNAVHISPGAFSAYRKSFFDKHGGYDVGNITEDLEVTFRIQYLGYKVENCPSALIHTVSPIKFKELKIQRRRWYRGLMQNCKKYRKMFSKKYGDLGVFVLPSAWLSIGFAVFFFIYALVKNVQNVVNEIQFLNSINFYFGNYLDFSKYFFENLFFNLFTDPIFYFVIISMSLVIIYVKYAQSKIGKAEGLFSSLVVFYIIYPMIFAYWWIVTFLYAIFNRKVSWR